MRWGTILEYRDRDPSTMNTPPLDEDRLAKVVSHICGCDAVAAAYLLGSAAAGRLRPDSDVDIAVLPRCGNALTSLHRLALAAELTRALGRDVDLGILSLHNLVYAKEAVARGRLIFERDHGVTSHFEMYVLSMYASLQEARREVLRAYAA